MTRTGWPCCRCVVWGGVRNLEAVQARLQWDPPCRIKHQAQQQRLVSGNERLSSSSVHKLVEGKFVGLNSPQVAGRTSARERLGRRSRYADPCCSVWYVDPANNLATQCRCRRCDVSELKTGISRSHSIGVDLHPLRSSSLRSLSEGISGLRRYALCQRASHAAGFVKVIV